MLKWLSANKVGINIVIAIVTALSGGAWVVYSNFTASSVPNDSKLIILLEKALDITAQQLVTKDTQLVKKDIKIEILQGQLRQSTSVSVSKAAKELAKKIPDDSADVYALSLKAIALGQYNSARKHLNILIKQQESDFNLQRDNLAKSYRARVETEYYDEQFTDALVWANKWVNLVPNRGDSLLYRGNVYASLKKYPKALADYTQAIKLDPNYAKAFYNRGVVYDTLKQYPKALADYTQAIKLDANYTIAFNNRGIVYATLKQYPKALADFETSYKLEPNNINYINSLVWFYSTSSLTSLRNPAKALSLTNEGLINSNNPQLLDTAAAAYAENNDFVRAISLSQKALTLAQGNKEYSFIISEIEKHLQTFRKKLPIRE